MANVIPATDANGTTDRAQLLLVAGLMIALTLVLLAILLNSVIYAENLGTRGSDVGGNEALDFEQSVHESTAEMLGAINYDADAVDMHGELTDQFNESHAEWHNQSTQHLVGDGTYSATAVDDVEVGSQIRQTEARPFTNASGDETWTVVEESKIRDYRLTFTEVEDSSEHFQLLVTGANGDEWSLQVTTDENDPIELRTERNGELVECDIDDEPVTIDFHAEIVNDGACDDVIFADGLESPYETVAYENGDLVEGTYRLMVDNTAVESADDFNSYDTSPYVVSGLYAATVSLTYDTERIDYESRDTVTPREIHD
ncbi:hypothetical protein ACLI4Z_04190 [Natrialbaceae archaeon A-arb3/5]